LSVETNYGYPLLLGWKLVFVEKDRVIARDIHCNIPAPCILLPSHPRDMPDIDAVMFHDTM
jgi:hypothetical protein